MGRGVDLKINQINVGNYIPNNAELSSKISKLKA